MATASTADNELSLTGVADRSFVNRKFLYSGCVESGTGTRGQGTWGLGDSGTWGRGDVGMCGLGEVRTTGLWDAAMQFRSIEFQKWENIPKKVELLMLFCKNDQLYAFQVPAKYTAKFKNWILENSFSPPDTQLDGETKQEI